MAACGGIPKVVGIARDNLEDLNSKLNETAGSDLIITSAGVSKGDYDIVKDVLTQRGDMNFLVGADAPRQAACFRAYQNLPPRVSRP